MSLYNCKSTTNHEVFRITKIDDPDGEEHSYLVGPKQCECEGFAKHARCRHLTMRIMFMTKHHIDDEWFLDFYSRTWKEFREVFSDKSSDLIIEQVTTKADDLELGAPRAALSDGEGVVSPSPPPEVEQPPAPSGVSSPSGNDLWIEL